MSLYFDIMICCDLREDTPPGVIDVIRYLTSSDFPLPHEPVFWSYSGTDDDLKAWDIREGWQGRVLSRRYPNEEAISSFQYLLRDHRFTEQGWKKIYRWSLQYMGRGLLDDDAYHGAYQVVFWIAQYACTGFVGTIRESDGYGYQMIFAENGEPKSYPLPDPTRSLMQQQHTSPEESKN